MEKRLISSFTFRELISLMKTLNGNTSHPMSLEKLYESIEPLFLDNFSFSLKTLKRRINENTPGKQLTPSFISQIFNDFRMDFFHNDEFAMLKYILSQLETTYHIDISPYLQQQDQRTAENATYRTLIDDICHAIFTPTQTPNTNRVVLCTYEDLQSNFQMSADQIANTLVANDYALYEQLSKEHESTASTWSAYLSFYPESFRYLVANGVIVGNWSFMLLNPEQVSQVVSGTFQEASCLQSDSPFLFAPGDYSGFLLNFSVNQKYRTAENYQLLFTAFADELLNLAKQGIFFEAFYTHAFGTKYQPVYKSLGFIFPSDITTTLGYATVGILSLNTQGHPFPSTLGTISPELRSLYDTHFRNTDV